MHTEDLEGRSPISIFRSKKGPHLQRTKPRFSPQPRAHILHFGLLEVLKRGRCSFPTRLDIISTRYQNSSRNKNWAVENSNIFKRRKRKTEKGGHLPENKINFFTNTTLSAMKRFSICSLSMRSMIPPNLNVLTFSPLTGGCSEGLDAFRFFFELHKAVSDSMSSHRRNNFVLEIIWGYFYFLV